MPSQRAAARRHIALPRVTSADGLLMAQPFRPALFRAGPRAWPSSLFVLLQGLVSELQSRRERAALGGKLRREKREAK